MEQLAYILVSISIIFLLILIRELKRYMRPIDGKLFIISGMLLLSNIVVIMPENYIAFLLCASIQISFTGILLFLRIYYYPEH